MGCSMHIIGIIGQSLEGLENMRFTPLTFPIVRGYLASKQK